MGQAQLHQGLESEQQDPLPENQNKPIVHTKSTDPECFKTLALGKTAASVLWGVLMSFVSCFYLCFCFLFVFWIQKEFFIF